MAKIKNLLIKSLAVAFVLLIGIGVVIYTNKYNNRKITDIQLTVNAPENRLMLIDSMLLKSINNEANGLVGSNLKGLNHKPIVEKLSIMEAVDTVYISCGVSGILMIEVIQKTPVAKVLLSQSEVRYLTDNGELIKSKYYGEELISINGNTCKNTHQLVSFIEKDKFFKAITQSITIDKNNRHLLATNYTKQAVDVGEIINLKEKSDNLRYFFEAIGDNIDKYKEFNLNYKNQIVAIKK